MNGSSVTLDKVEIQISASAGAAKENISQLADTLTELRSAVKGGFNNLSKLADSLKQLKSASKNLDEVSKNLSSISNIKNALNSLSAVQNPKGLEKTISNLEKLPTVFNKIDGKSIENMARVSNQLSNALTPLADKLSAIGQGFSSVNQLANRYGVSVTKIREYTKQATGNTKHYNNAISNISKLLRAGQKANESFVKSVTKNTSNMISKIKQIGLSLLGTRTIFTATRKAVSEYMKMDAELTWQITNNWKALGAQLAPAIENVTWLFKQFVRVIYSIILALTGIDLIARANEKAMQGWGKAAKDTLGNLQKFDDLNVAEFPKSSGGDDNSLIELDTIDLTPIQKVIDWVRKLKDEIKEAWNTGQWEGVGEVFAEGINTGLNAINFDWIEDKFKNIAENFGEFLKGAVNNFDWELFGRQLTRQLSLIPRLLTRLFKNIPWEELGNGLNKTLQSFDISFLIDSIGDSIISLVDGVQKALLNIDGATIGIKIGDGIISFFRNIDKLFDTINWDKLGNKITEVILNIPWERIFNSIINSLTKVIGSAGNLLDGLLGTTIFTQISDDINGIINDISQIGTTIINTLGENSSAGAIFTSMESILGSISGLARDISDTLTKWIISDDFQSIIKMIEDTFATILNFVDDVIKSFKDWYEGEGGSELRELLGTLTSILKDVLELILPEIEKLYDRTKSILDGYILPTLTKVLHELNFWLGILKDIISFVKNVFKGDWSAAFEDIKNITSKIWDHIADGFKGMANKWIEYFERAINYIIDKLNWLPNKINSLLGSDLLKKIGVDFKVGSISHVSLPRLRTGTNLVPQDGPYYLHANEAVVPEKYNPAVGGGTNEETNRKLDTLIDLIGNMETTNIVNIGNEQLYRQQKKYTDRKINKYGTIEVQ